MIRLLPHTLRQVQLQKLVTGKPWANLMSWYSQDCTGLGVPASCTSDVMQHPTSKGTVPNEAFYKERYAVALRALTNAALAKLNKEPATLAQLRSVMMMRPKRIVQL